MIGGVPPPVTFGVSGMAEGNGDRAAVDHTGVPAECTFPDGSGFGWTCGVRLKPIVGSLPVDGGRGSDLRPKPVTRGEVGKVPTGSTTGGTGTCGGRGWMSCPTPAVCGGAAGVVRDSVAGLAAAVPAVVTEGGAADPPPARWSAES